MMKLFSPHKFKKMSQVNLLLTISLIVCFISLLEVEGQLPDTNIQFRDEVDLAAHTCSGPTTCTLMTKCVTPFSSRNRKQYPRICKWDNSVPWVCCPTPNKLINKPLKEFPENECAGHQWVLVSAETFGVKSLTTLEEEVKRVGGGGGIGGENVTNIDFFPFVAAIYQMAGNEKVFLCGGTLLSKDVILTAAHCFLAKDESSEYMVQLGSAYFGISRNSSDQKEFQVTSVKVHEEFEYPQLYNDIALVKFQGLKEYSDATRPICLNDGSKDDTGRPNVTVILGWGATQIGGSLSPILQKVYLKVIHNAVCNSRLAKLGASGVNFPRGITDKIVCAESKDDIRRDACQGDSGGPLLTLDGYKWRQRGIVSGGIGCGIPGNPGMYTRVSEYITWIKQNA